MSNEDEPSQEAADLQQLTQSLQEQLVQFIGSTEVCKRLGIDRGTLTRWIQLGRITPAGKLPGPSGAYLWDPAYIDRFVAQRAGDEASADQPTDNPPHTCGPHCSGVPYDARNIS